MSHARWTLVLVSIPALSPAALATVSDRYTLKIGSLQSQAQFELASSLGPCLLGSGAQGSLAGELDLVLRPGVPPASTAQFDGGRCGVGPNLLGIVPSSVPGSAPLLVVHLSSFVFAPRSRVFACDPDGNFLAQTQCEVSEGQLDVSILGRKFVSVPILGLRSESTRSRGRVWIDEEGVHLLCEIDNRIHVRVPDADLSLHIGVRGLLRGDAEFPVPTRFRPARAQRIRQPVECEVLSRISPSEQALLATTSGASPSLPVLLEELQLLPSAGDGPRLAADRELFPDALATPVPLPGRAVLARSLWSFQFAYREMPADAAWLAGQDRRDLGRPT